MRSRRRLARNRRRSRLRVVFYDHCARMSGAEISMLNTVTALEADCTVILGEDGPLAGHLRRRGIQVLILALPARTREYSRAKIGLNHGVLTQGADIAGYGRRLARQLRRLHPDVVVSNSMKGHVLLAAARPFHRLPVVNHVHDRLSTDFMARGGVLLERLVIGALGRGVIANSRSTMATVPRSPLHAVRAVIGGPVESPPTRASAEGTPGGSRPLRFGILGRLSPWKGQDLLIRAFAAAFPDGPHTLEIAGAALFGEDDYAASIRETADRLDVGDRVRFLGHVDDVYAVMGGWDCLVHASTIPEPFGLVIAQAMAFGLPIIASGEGGPAEMLVDGETGFLFTPRDMDDLVQVLRRVATDPAGRTAVADAARQHGMQYTERPVAGRILKVLEQVAG